MDDTCGGIVKLCSLRMFGIPRRPEPRCTERYFSFKYSSHRRNIEDIFAIHPLSYIVISITFIDAGRLSKVFNLSLSIVWVHARNSSTQPARRGGPSHLLSKHYALNLPAGTQNESSSRDD